ncbi:MAG: SDR family oxidoreductase [Aggregatilineales bacterium]
MNIVIFGASSTIGQASIPLLREAGHTLRLVSRNPEKLQQFTGADVEIMQADLLDEQSVRRACEGVDMVLASVASMFGHGKNASKNVDYTGQCRLIDIARENSVQHFVYISTQEATHDNPVSFFRNKARTEDYLRESGLSYTILRASAFFSPHVELIGDGILKGGKAMIMGQGENPRNFIANCDVAKFVVVAFDNPAAHNQTIDIGGLDNLTSKQVAEVYAKVAGVDLKSTQIPRFIPRIMSKLIKPFHTGISDVMTAVVDSDTRSKAFDMSATLTQYPVELTSLEDWIAGQMQTKQKIQA